MANQRDKSKKLIGFYANPDAKKAIEAVAKARGITVAELLRGIAKGTIKLSVIAFVALHCFKSPLNWSLAALEKTGKAGVAMIAKAL